MSRSFALASLIVLFLQAALASAGGYRPRVGDCHPDFELPRIDGGAPVSLSDFRGKKVLLIHFASW